MERKLYRSSDDRMLSGVLGGLAEYFEISSSVLRILFVIVALFSGQPFLMLLLYFLGAIFIPINPNTFKYGPNGGKSSNVGGFAEEFSEEKVVDAFKEERNRKAIGIALVILGAFLLITNIFYIPREYVFALALIVLGIWVVFKSDRGGV